MLPRTTRMGQEQLNNYVLLVTDADASTTVKMSVANRVVHARMTSSNTVTIELPAVAEAAGLIFVVRAITDGGGVKIQDKDDSMEWTDPTTDADGEYGIYYSDGFQWFVLVTDIT